VPTTISALRRLRAPATLGPARVRGAETATYRVVARLLAARTDATGGLVIVVADPVTGGSLVTTIPSRDCLTAVPAATRTRINGARTSFTALCGAPPGAFQQLRGQATITGVGFFSALPQPADAPGRLELSPVTGLSSVGCRRGPATGLYGVVRRGPTTPNCRRGVPCTEPVAGTMLLFSAGGHILARARSASDGSYRVELAPGLYTVRAEGGPGLIGRTLRPSLVRVTDGPVTRVEFKLDTGIR
jgi:hypothetical protein